MIAAATLGVDEVENAHTDTVSPGNIEISYGVKSNVPEDPFEITTEYIWDPPDTVVNVELPGTLDDAHDCPAVIRTPLFAVVPSIGTNVVGPLV